MRSPAQVETSQRSLQALSLAQLCSRSSLLPRQALCSLSTRAWPPAVATPRHAQQRTLQLRGASQPPSRVGTRAVCTSRYPESLGSELARKFLYENIHVRKEALVRYQCVTPVAGAHVRAEEAAGPGWGRGVT
jgi:hypothetical protein